MLKNLIRKFLIKIREFISNELRNYWEANSILTAQLHIQRVKSLKEISSLKEVEFKVFSERGEDGIIQYFINNIEIKNKIFIEFGVEDYRESNTRFLLVNDLWKGLVIDSNKNFIAKIKKDVIYYKYDLTAVHTFITKENINQIIVNTGIKGDIGLLSIDIDGNDYWIWETINVINPAIVICEYNSLFGMKLPVSIPYEANFNRTKAHYSNLYFGVSLPALVNLASQKNYAFVGSNSAGSNAFFVKKELSSGLKIYKPEEGYIQSQFRQSRDKKGNLNFLSWEESKEIISNLRVVNVETGETLILKNIF
jgi:hypothetical protein